MQQEYQLDQSGNTKSKILRGQDPNWSVPVAIFSSYTDALNGFSQQIKQFTFGGCLEYEVQLMFFLRGGYQYQDASLGDICGILQLGLGSRGLICSLISQLLTHVN